jgi:hypothetical protein
MFDLITVLTYSRSLRRACDARSADHDNAEAEEEARVALLRISNGMGVTIHPERPGRWNGTEQLARDVEAAAVALAATSDGSFQQVGAIATLALRFGAIANRLGFDIDPDSDSDARVAVEGRTMEAAE